MVGSDIGDGGTSTIATGMGAGKGTAGAGSDCWTIEMTGGVTIAAGVGAGAGGLVEISTRALSL